MAKRKRLTAPSPDEVAAEGTPMLSNAPLGVIPKRRAPIADVAGQAATNAALERVAGELTQAKAEGRMIQKISLGAIDETHLIRDRIALDGEEMESLKASLSARGQQTPIEVVQTAPGQFGLISGYRRLMALRELAQGDEAPAPVLALVRSPQDASEAYTAMVEENEVRVGLSYFERANIVVRAVQAGVFPSEAAALKDLFAAASRTKRSKIKSFLPVVAELGGALQYPAALSERLGLALSAKLEGDAKFADRLRDRLRKAQVGSPEAEVALLSKALGEKQPPAAKTKPAPAKTAQQDPLHTDILPSGLKIQYRRGEMHLYGDDMDAPTIARVIQLVRGA